jgi:transcriptional regulator with XRE-family HTH domain
MLREHRQDKRLSRRALAEIIDISPTTLANIELGTHDPTLWSLARIVDALSIDPATVFEAIDRRQ